LTTNEVLPESLLRQIVALSQTVWVRSVSLPFKDAALWNELLAVQRMRAADTNSRPEMAMPLIATDGPIPSIHDGDGRMLDGQSGSIFCVFDESTAPADIFAWPSGAGIPAERSSTAENLSQAVFDPWYQERSSYCKYFITPSAAVPVIKGTTQSHFGSWTLYSASDPNYVDSLPAETLHSQPAKRL
jgi:hypothetical protein